MTGAPDIAVIDASIALKWALNEDDSAAAFEQLARWEAEGIQPIAPSWIACEVANVLYRYVRGNHLTLEEAEALIDLALDPLEIQAEVPGDARRAIRIAHEVGDERTYDAQYVALAERLSCELWTADRTFWRKAQQFHPYIRLLRNAQQST
jgi:predicted nucleic acid-binding protein